MRLSSHEPQATISLVKCCSPIPQLPYCPRRRISLLIISKIIIIFASREFEIFPRENLRWLTNPGSHWLKNVKEWCLHLKNASFHVILLIYNQIILFKSILIILRIIHNFYKSPDKKLLTLCLDRWQRCNSFTLLPELTGFRQVFRKGRYTLYHSFSCPKFQLPIKSPDVTIFEKQC